MAIKLGIVGAGVMGSRIGSRIALGDIPEFELAGIHDVDPARADAVGTDFDTTTVSAIDEFAGRVDALYIATPDALHAEPCVRAAELGIPFLVEKPLATTVEDAERIADAVRQAGITAEVNFSNRWNPPFAALKQQVEDMGDFVTLSACLNNTIASPLRNLAWAANTTPAWFLLSHCIDLGYWLHRKPAASVYASAVRGLLAAHGVDTWDSMRLLVRHADGTDASFESVWVLPEGQPFPVEFTFRYVGQKGAATVDTSHQMITVLTPERATDPITLNWTPQRFRAFARTLGGAEPGATIDDGVQNTRTLVAAHRSLETGVPETV